MSEDEATTAIAFPISAVGFVSNMPSGPGVVSEESIARISPKIPPGISRFLLTSANSVEEIISQQRRCGVNVIQICDSMDPSCLETLRRQLPGISLVPVVHVVDLSSLEEAVGLATYADAILLDTGARGGAARQLGGTGATHDWSISRKIRDAVAIPIFLAGGLRASNVTAAIEVVRPFGVDVCSGVRTNGQLDRDKLAAFVEAVYSAA